MAVTDSVRAVALPVSAAARLLAALASLWWRDVVSYLDPGRRARLARLLGGDGPLVVTGDRAGGFSASGLPLVVAPPEAAERLVSLRIEPEAVMHRRIEVPNAAAAALDTALAMNLESWTPFSEADVYALARPVAAERSGPHAATTLIEIRCAPRRLVDDRIGALAERGLEPDGIQLGDAGFEIARSTARRRTRQQRQRWLAALGVLALVQGGTLHALVAGRQLDAIESLQADLERETERLRAKAGTDKRAAQRHDAFGRIAARFDAGQSVSRALQTLAAALPAGVIVREIAFNRDRAEGTLTLAGAQDLDVAGLLTATRLYTPREITATGAAQDGQRLYAVAFTVSGWTPPERGPRR